METSPVEFGNKKGFKTVWGVVDMSLVYSNEALG